MTSSMEERRLHAARQRFPEISLDDFDVAQTGLNRWTFTHRATGTRYRPLEVDLRCNDLADVAAFTVDAEGNVHFVRRRGEAGGLSG